MIQLIQTKELFRSIFNGLNLIPSTRVQHQDEINFGNYYNNGIAIIISNNKTIYIDITGKHWYLNDKRHREDGPAIERFNGGKEWFINGERHRINGPAIEQYNGDKHWFQRGYRHRTDGPACEYSNGYSAYYLNNIYCHGAVFEERAKKARDPDDPYW